jgi:hypothetical protein
MRRSAMISTYELYSEVKNEFSIDFIIEKLSLHSGTVKRWDETKKVPVSYFYDLNKLINFKYKQESSFREKNQFFTKSALSQYCVEKTEFILNQLNIDTSDFTYIEPSAGCCNFYNLLPKDRRIGVDIEPKGELSNELIKSDYLDYIPPEGKYIVIGNPPFGLRGNLALRFINHSNKFADFVAFILPPLFNSKGKGVPMKRVEGYKLIHSEILPKDSYEYPDGSPVDVTTIFQIWSKFGESIITSEIKQNYINIYSLSNGNSSGSKRNVKMIGKCDVYLPSTCFKGMRAYLNFDDLPNKRGYGLVINIEKNKIVDLITNKIDWEKVAFVSTNGAVNLRTDLIISKIMETL